jgi:Txe/YoeB family toxin of Txe-Axe toxin-antitoxin module
MGMEMSVPLWFATAVIAMSVSFGGAPAYGQATSSGTAPLQASGETSAASEIDQPARFEPRCLTTPDVTHVDSVEEKFIILRQARQRISQFLQQDSSDRDYYKQQLENRGYSPVAAPEIVSPTEAVTEEDLEGMRDNAASLVKNITEKLDEAQRSPATGLNIEDLKSQKAGAESRLAEIERRIKNRDAAKKRIEEFQKQFEELQKARQAQITRLQTLLRAVNSDIDCLTRAQAQVDETINTLLIPETQKNTFKLWVSALFAFMVILVIVGFFTVAFRDKSVASAIFSNQTGIQFVTLFSLVIAIILFGITDILQAKELSALLGGISGYILGRVTTDRSGAGQLQQQPASKTVVASNSIAFAAPNSINGPAGLFSGFSAGGKISISGTTNPANSGTFTILSATPSQITTQEQTLVDEAAGPIVTITSL